jgi:tRNA A-37 threonylcarbamoyl transferase component Bud32
MTGLPEEVLRFLDVAGLSPMGPAAPLTGGVSSDIWLVPLHGHRAICVKRALPQLRVAATWHAPVERNRYEARWYQLVSAIQPGLAPRVLAHDETAGIFAMDYLPSENFVLWKSELMAGRVDPAPFPKIGMSIAAVHAATANRADIATEFESDENFEALRLAPYLRATAERHPDLADNLRALADRTALTKLALVHGDLSPKNILIGAGGAPVLLDAECAWFGDPAFDPAFCLNHLFLKALHMPEHAQELLAGARSLWRSYEANIDWEPRANVATRTAALLPALMLARIDGKSPVEYISEERARENIRRLAKEALKADDRHPDEVVNRIHLHLKERK